MILCALGANKKRRQKTLCFLIDSRTHKKLFWGFESWFMLEIIQLFIFQTGGDIYGYMQFEKDIQKP